MPKDTSDADRLRREIGDLLRSHGLTLADVALLDSGNRLPGEEVLAAALEPGEFGPERLAYLRAICHVLDDRLGSELERRHARLFRGGLGGIASAARGLFAFALLVGVTYLVVGGVLEGRSLLTDHPAAAAALLAFLVAVLAIFEGLQISVAVLRLSDLDAYRGNFRRLRRLHSIFRFEEGTRRFLAGRQFAVIVVVFFLSRVTTFSGVTFPFSVVEMPDQFRVAAYDWGLAGALFVLWWGQLLPQFLANRRPMWFGDLGISTAAFRAGEVVERLGITSPAHWAVWLDRQAPEPEIPISAQRRYRQALKIEGSAQLGVTRTWVISCPGQGVGTYQVATLVASDAIESLHVEGPLWSQPPPESTVGSQRLTRADSDVALKQELRTEAFAEFHKQVAEATPKVGWFRDGDLLATELTQRGEDPGNDCVPIGRPTKHLIFRVVVTDPPASFQGVALTISRPGEIAAHAAPGWTERGHVQERWIDARVGEDGAAVAEAYHPYPDVGAYYWFSWQVEW